MRNYDAVFQEAAMLGVTITVAAGDHGSSDVDPNDKKQRVDFPSAALLCSVRHASEVSGTYFFRSGLEHERRLLAAG
jgi:hypothetical protein